MKLLKNEAVVDSNLQLEIEDTPEESQSQDPLDNLKAEESLLKESVVKSEASDLELEN